MKKLISFLLLLSLLLTLLASCTDGKKPDDGTTEESTVTTEEPKIVYELPLIVDGKTSFKIIFDQNADDEVKTAISSLRSRLKTVTGVNFASDTDELIFGKQPDSDAYEILIGNTTRPESALAREKLVGVLDYGVIAEGHKLCFVAGDSTNLCAAIYFFSSYVLGQLRFNEGEPVNVTITSENDYIYRYPYTNADATLLGNDVSKYSVVYPAAGTITEYRIAALMQKMICIKTGRSLPLCSDDQVNSEYEIRIGKTDQTAVEVPSSLEYVMNVSGNSFELVAGSIYAYDCAYRSIVNNFFSQIRDVAANSGEFAHKNITEQIKKDKNESVLGKSGEFRILYHNVLGWDDEKKTRMPNLANEMMIQLYQELDADVICLQEYTELMRNAGTSVMDGLVAAGYAEVPVNTGISDLRTATPILYNTETVELLNETSFGVYKFNQAPSGDKFATWAIFKTKTGTPKTFAVISVHLDYQAADTGRLQHISELENNVLPLVETYQCPIMIGGDLNCTDTSQPFQALLNLGFTDTHTVAEKNDGVGGPYLDGHPLYDKTRNILTRDISVTTPYKNAIDHILYKGTGISFKYYDVLGDTYTGAISDHPSTVLDFDLS